MNIKDFAKKLVMGFVIWGVYSLEVLWITIFIDHWIDPKWITITYEGNPFINGIGWFLGFLFLTGFCLFVTEIIVNDPE